MNNNQNYLNNLIVSGAIALENFQDDMHFHNQDNEETNQLINKCFKVINEYYHIKKNKVYDISFNNTQKECYTKLNEVIIQLGTKYFTQNDVGDIKYKYNRYKQ